MDVPPWKPIQNLSQRGLPELYNTTFQFCVQIGTTCNWTHSEWVLLNKTQIASQMFTDVRQIGYPITLTYGILGFILNSLLAHVICKLCNHGRLQWKHKILVINTCVLDGISSVGLAADALINIFCRCTSKHVFGLSLFEMIVMISALYVPAMGYAVEGIFQLMAVRSPIWYASNVSDALCKKIVLGQWICGLGLQAVGIAFVSIYERGQSAWHDVYKAVMVFDAFYGPYLLCVVCIFAWTYVSISIAILRRPQPGPFFRSRRMNTLKQFRLQLILQFLSELTYLITHALNLGAVLSACQLMLMSTSYSCFECQSAAKLNLQLTRNINIQWVAYYIWTVRVVVEPCLLLFGHNLIRNALFYGQSPGRLDSARTISVKTLISDRSSIPGLCDYPPKTRSMCRSDSCP